LPYGADIGYICIPCVTLHVDTCTTFTHYLWTAARLFPTIIEYHQATWLLAISTLQNRLRSMGADPYEMRIRNVEYDSRTSHRWSCPQRLWCRDPTHIIIINFPLEPMMWYKTRGMSGYANWTELMAGVTKQKTNFALKISTEFNLCYIITKHPEVFKLKTQRDHTRRSTEYRHFLLHFGKPIKAYEPKRRIFTNENLSSNRRNKARVPFNVLRSLSLKWPKISKLWMTWMFYWTA